MCRTIQIFGLAMLWLFLVQTVHGQMLAWDVDGQPGNQELFEATTIAPYLETAFLVRGDGLNPNSLANSFNSSSFSADTSFTVAVENDEYIAFSIRTKPGFSISLTTLDANIRRSSSGPFLFQWQYSLDDFATEGIDIGDVIEYDGTETNGVRIDQIDLSTFSDLQDVGSGTTITFRLYGWGASSGAGSFAIGRLSGDNLAIDGTYTVDIGTDGPIIFHTPSDEVLSTGDRLLTAHIVGDELVIEGVDRPVLWYRVDGGAWNHAYFTAAEEDVYEFVLPGQEYGRFVEYYLAARDQHDVRTSPEGGSGTDPVGNTAPSTFYSYTVEEVTIDGLVFYFTRDPGDVSEENWVYYPYAGMGSEEGDVGFHDPDDWTYLDPVFPFYLVVEGDSELIAAEFSLNWNPELGEVDISMGNLFPDEGSYYFTETVGSGRMRVNALSLAGNVTPDAGEYLATISVTATRPGHHELSIDDISLRYYDDAEDAQVEIPGTSFPGEIKFYLGDFGYEDGGSFAGAQGDGSIDYADLMLFSNAYWSQRGDAGYMTKYDVGPTNESGSYFTLPAADGSIDFEDLVIFAIGYYRSADNLLPKQMNEPLRMLVYDAERDADGSVRIPLGFERNRHDLRAFSLELKFPEDALRYRMTTRAGDLDRDLGFLAARENDGIVMIDAAIVGRNSEAFSREGVFAHLYFDANGTNDAAGIDIISAKARDGSNRDIPVEIVQRRDESPARKPVRFDLAQNYPNPFNPTTTIAYQVPLDLHVDIVVYTILGEEVVRLVSEFHESGYYTVAWNGMNAHGRPVPSGLYLYRMQAGEFVATKRMLFLK
jgi:hypothetical protein